MDSSDIWIILVILVLAAVWTYSRQRNSGTPKLNAVLGIMTDIDNNLKTVTIHETDPQSKKKFTNGNWRRFGGRLVFLDKSLAASLKDTFAMVEEINSRINTARKSHNTVALADLPLGKLKEGLSSGKSGLNDWLRANMETELKRGKGHNPFRF